MRNLGIKLAAAGGLGLAGAIVWTANAYAVIKRG